MLMTHNIAVFASGSGTNALNLIQHFENHPTINIVLVAANKADAGVLDKAKKENIPTVVFDRATFKNEEQFMAILNEYHVNFVVLAGFLWMIPPYLTKAFENKMVNIHPSLLPNYGGKGMYGMNVHQAVSDAKESETGITIHYVNEKYDDGEIILQEKFAITPGENPEKIAQQIHQYEYKYFPIAIEKVLT